MGGVFERLGLEIYRDPLYVSSFIIFGCESPEVIESTALLPLFRRR